MYVFDEYWVGLLLRRVKRISLCFVISTKKIKDTPIHLDGSLFVENKFGETLTFNDVMDKEEVTQAGGNHAIDESSSSSRRHCSSI